MGEIEENLNAARPSSDTKFAEKVRRMIQPEALKKKEPLIWSPGMGVDVWEMFCACITGDSEKVNRLVEKDPSLARCHYEYRTPLSFAARENQVEIAAYLLDHGADPFGVGGDLIQVARERGYIEMEQLLSSKYAAMFGASAKGNAVAAAIRERDIEQVRQLLDNAPDLIHAGDKYSNQPIHWSVMTRQLDVIDDLLARGADINARRGHAEIARLLTEYEETGALPAHSLEEYETLAKALVEAYNSGDDAAMRRVIEHFQLQRPLFWDQPPPAVRVARLRRNIRERLGKQSDSENECDTLELAAAQLLIARSLGLKDWAQLVKLNKA